MSYIENSPAERLHEPRATAAAARYDDGADDQALLYSHREGGLARIIAFVLFLAAAGFFLALGIPSFLGILAAGG